MNIFFVMFGIAAIAAIIADIWAARSNRAMGRPYAPLRAPLALTHYSADGSARPVVPLNETNAYRRLVLDKQHNDELVSVRLRRAEQRREKRARLGAAYAAKYGGAHYPPS